MPHARPNTRFSLLTAMSIAAMIWPGLVRPVAAQAPVAADGGLALGVKAGVGSTGLAYSGDSDAFDREIGWTGGVYVSKRFLRVFSVGAEALLARKGASDAVIDQRVTLDYLEVPVLLQVHAGRGAYVFAGPAIDLQLRARFGDVDVADSYEKRDVVLVAGGGAALGRLLVEGRVSWGLRNVSADLIGGETITSRAFYVMGGYRLR
jgi:hypothetical protein